MFVLLDACIRVLEENDATLLTLLARWHPTRRADEIDGSGGAATGLHEHERWTEKFQANIYGPEIAMLRRVPALAGLSPWILMDFQSPVRLLPGVQNMRNRKGIVDPNGERKQSFFALQQFYRERARP